MRDPNFPSDGGLSIAFSMIERALTDGLSTNRFGRREAETVKQFFFDKGREHCVFCGDRDPNRWDHLIPLKEGGETVIGNIVPACQPCDDSKQHNHFEKWMLGTAPKSPRSRGIPHLDARIERLKSYMEEFKYLPRPLASRLTTEQYQQLQLVFDKIRSLRAEVERFIVSNKDTL